MKLRSVLWAKDHVLNLFKTFAPENWKVQQDFRTYCSSSSTLILRDYIRAFCYVCGLTFASGLHHEPVQYYLICNLD